MTRALITVDTELSAGRQRLGMDAQTNLASSFLGEAHGAQWGVPWLMARMRERGITGVFFVDPMPGLVHGQRIVEQMVEPVLAAGHEVQLHIHTEWLAFAKDSPVDGRLGRNIGDFGEADQITLLGWARDAIMAAGAPAPAAFRAGNYGANAATLRALAALGIGWDSSFNADYAGLDCQLDFPRDLTDPVERDRVWEMPVAGIWDRPGHLRPAQVCALSVPEMRAGLAHAAQAKAHSFAIVTHSFEMLTRDRRRPNPLMIRRFEALCDAIAADPRLTGAGFANLPLPKAGAAPSGRAAASQPRTWARVAEQAWAQVFHERAWRTA